ncbi:MAG: hypothetical protein DK306_001429 [Chloroflexi bacterium]|nr:MAG: hypothetical protein DK306_001429 [Chloroflexota bacterium]
MLGLSFVLLLQFGDHHPVAAQAAPAPATITTSLLPPGPVLVGESASVAANIGGVFRVPSSGEVSFFYCAPATVQPGLGCPQGAGTQVGPLQQISASGLHFSFATPLTEAGAHCFGVLLEKSIYTTTYFTDTTSACIAVQKVFAEIVTAATPTGTVDATSVIARDRATLTGALQTPTGTVRFFLCGPAQALGAQGCPAPAGTQIGAAIQLVAGTAESPSVDVSVAGLHCWRVEYGGDNAHQAATHTNTTSECFSLQIPPPPQPGDQIDVTLDANLDAQQDGDGIFYRASTPDGSVRIRVRDLPPEVTRLQLLFTPLRDAALAAVLDTLAPQDRSLVETATGIATAGEVLLFNADTGAKIDATIEVELAPLAVPDVRFLLWLVETPDGTLAPVEYTAALDGALRARFAFDLIFIILDLPAPQTELRTGLNTLVYTGPQMPADRAFPGGTGRGDGIEALWRFTGFGFEAFFPDVPSLANPTYRLYDPLFVTTTPGGAQMQQGLLAPVRRGVALTSGSNLVAYTGAGGGILNLVDPAVLARTQAVWVWRDSVGAWLGFFPSAPPGVSGITALALGDFVFLHASGPVTWDMR